MNLGTSSKGTEVWLEIPIQLLILFCPKTKRTLERNRISVFKTRKGGRLWMQSSTKNKKKNTTCQSVQTVTENEEGIHVFGLKLPIIQNKVQPQVFHWKAEFVIVLSSFLPFFLHGSPPTPPPPVQSSPSLYQGTLISGYLLSVGMGRFSTNWGQRFD